MITLYRFAHEKYKDDLSGEGARLYGARWNSKGFPVVYTSTTISLSLLELFIHKASYDEIATNFLMIIEVGGDLEIPEIRLSKLKEDWAEDEGNTRWIGDEFLKASSSLLLRVPSAIIPEETNVLINPRHKDFKKVKVKAARKFEFDARLFK
jgi:RES domain-containing protein